jgi:peptidyl-tRNA hydrolase
MNERAAPEENLPQAAHPAWDAYCAMLTSKAAHFEFLVALDRKVAEGGRRTLAEAARLDTLLAAHTRAVGIFREAVIALGRIDIPARDALLAHIKIVNDRSDDDGPTRH